MYIDIGNLSGDSATLTFSLAAGAVGTRVWDIKVTQVECSNPNAPDNGCLQYHTGVSGRIETFNWDSGTEAHANNQQYTVCIRQEDGYCCVQFMPCADEAPGGFELDGGTMGNADDDCQGLDYIGIPGAGSICNCCCIRCSS